MNKSMNVPAFRRARGASVVTVLIAIAIIVALLAASWFLILRPHQQAVKSNKPATIGTSASTSKAAPAPVNVEAMSTSELLSEASKAIKDQRLLSPAGNNAVEFYLKALDRDPDNRVARDALREMFPFAANAAEQVINQGDFSEAKREIDLLTRTDPDNYTLTILRSKLDARRRVKVEQAEAKELAAKKQAAAAAAAVEAKARDAELAKQQAEQQAAQKAAAEKAAQEQALAANQVQAKQHEDRQKTVIQDAVLVKRVVPKYPVAAARTRREGWVNVRFTVGVNGKVHKVSVVDSNPSHVFDRAATRAVARWEFKPALRNGKAMAVTMTRRVVFKLNDN